MANCKKCGAEIIWVELENAQGERKPHPLDAKPEPHSRIVRFAGGDIARRVRTWVSHFATCEFADDFRKDRGG